MTHRLGSNYPAGVPTPFVAHVHPYPTRFHGGIWTRPVFGFPQMTAPSTVFLPPRDIQMTPDKPYQGPGIQGLGILQYDVGEGVFRPGGYGGGVFDGNLAGLGADAPSATDQTDYPYGTYSDKTKALQQKINVALKKNGLCPISADGKLGAATCGAALDARVMTDPDIMNARAFAPTTCQALTPVKSSSSGCGISAPSSSSSPASLTPSSSLPLISSSTKKVLGFLAGGLGAVAIVYVVKKRRARR